MSMNCCSTDLLLDWLDKSLDAAQASEVGAHLNECPACRQRLAEVSEGYQFLRSELPAARESIRTPEFLAMRIKHKLSHSQDDSWWERRRAISWAAAAAIAVLLSASLAYRLASSPGSSSNIAQAPLPTAVNTTTNRNALQPLRVLVIVPSVAGNRVQDLPRRDGGPSRLPNTQRFTAADEPAAQAEQPEPTVQSPVLMVKPASYDPEM